MTFERLKPPYRAEHVGSLLRPAELYNIRLTQDNSLKWTERGSVATEADKPQEKAVHDMELEGSERTVESIVDNAIRHAVSLQKECGMKTLTDGEFRRSRFFDGVFDKLSGMEHTPERPMNEFMPFNPYISSLQAQGVPHTESYFCSGKIKRSRPMFVEEFLSIKNIVAPEDVSSIKIDIITPSWYHQRHGPQFTYNREVYANDDEYFDDLCAAYREEIDELYNLGCRHIQIDDPHFTFFCQPSILDNLRSVSLNPETLLATYIRAVNLITMNRPKDLTISIHLCRGNFMGKHFAEGPYDYIADKVFPALDVDALYLEFDTERAGGLEPLKHVPTGMMVVLGLVSTKSPEMEDPAQVKERVYQAASVMTDSKRTTEQALNQLCISPQCGFASVWAGNPVTEQIQRDKLKLVADVAKEIWV